MVLGLLFFSAMTGFWLTFSLYTQIGLHYSPLKAGLAGIPSSLGMVVAFIASQALQRFGRKVMHGGLVVMALGVAGIMLTLHLARRRGHPVAARPGPHGHRPRHGLRDGAVLRHGARLGRAARDRLRLRHAHLGAAVRRGAGHRHPRHRLLRAGEERRLRARRAGHPRGRAGHDGRRLRGDLPAAEARPAAGRRRRRGRSGRQRRGRRAAAAVHA
ncbi:hypothetical protein ACFQ1I_06810 [Kitasatospora arboriphila]